MLAVAFTGCKAAETIGIVESWVNLEYIPDEGYLNMVSQERSREPSRNVEQMDRLVSTEPTLMM